MVDDGILTNTKIVNNKTIVTKRYDNIFFITNALYKYE